MTSTTGRAGAIAATILTVVLAGLSAAGQADDAATATDKLFEAAAAYKFGQPETPLIAVAQQVRSS